MRLTNASRTKSKTGMVRAVFHVSGASSRSGAIHHPEEEIETLKQLLQLWDRNAEITIDVLDLIEKYKAKEVVTHAQANAHEDEGGLY